MKQYILSAIALVALTGTVFAQQPPVPPQPTPPAAGGSAPGSDAIVPPPPPPPPPVEGPRGPEDRAGIPPRGPEGPMGPHGRRPPPPPPSKAAHFHVEDGDTRIDIKCADDEPMKACSDILLQVIDRLNGPAHP